MRLHAASSARSSCDDPDVAGFGSFIGSSGGAQTANTGRVFIALKPRDEREFDRHRRSSTGCGRSSPRSRARRMFLQPAQDITVGGRIARAQFQYTLQDANLDELNRVVRQDARQAAHAAAARRRRQRPAGQRAAAQHHHQPRPGGALRHLTAGDRRHAQRRLRPAPDHAIFHAAQHLLRDPGNPARVAERPRARSTTSTSNRRSPAARCRCRRWSTSTPARSARCRSRIRASSRR